MTPTLEIIPGDCLESLRKLPDNSVDSIVTDPPYGLRFMGKAWDYDVPGVEVWAECLRVLKPGGHLLAFAGTRTQHRMACRIEDAGFEIRDMIAWVYGSGFPKSLDVSKAIDKAAGAEREVIGTRKTAKGKSDGLKGYDSTDMLNANSRAAVVDITAPATAAAREWDGWGTALKPALEPITLARKPLAGTVDANVLQYGTGALNVDGCRVATSDTYAYPTGPGGKSHHYSSDKRSDEVRPNPTESNPLGRFPANLIHDGSDEVIERFPTVTSGSMKAETRRAAQEGPGSVCYGTFGGNITSREIEKSSGSAARFFYCAKASADDRGEGNNHPTVKPNALMRYLCRLITPPGGIVLDPYMGSGSTGKAALEEGFSFIGMELDPAHVETAFTRCHVTPGFSF